MTHDTTRDANRGTNAATGTMTAPSSATWNLVAMDELKGRKVIGVDDESIGTVDDLYLDYDEHTVRYCTVDVGGFLGIGAKTVLIPFERLQWSGDDLYLPVERETLENAPEFDPTADYDRAYEEDLGSTWGVASYWTAPGYGTDHSHWRTGSDADRTAGMRHQDRFR